MSKGRILVGECNGTYLIKMIGDVRVTLCASLNRYVESIFRRAEVKAVLVDLLEAEGVDSTTLGLLTKLALQCRCHYDLLPILFCQNTGIIKVLESMSLNEYFHIVREAPDPTEIAAVSELPVMANDEDEARLSVLEAHRLLIEVNPECESEFIDLIRCLEDEVRDSNN